MPRASWRYNTPSAGSIRSPESSKTAQIKVEQPAATLCNSLSALKPIRNPSNKSGQRIIRAILQAASDTRDPNSPPMGPRPL
ncbi:hypothetical protein FQN51_008613 [Onygenales sp. PD_10]|nr:hypothetical protein FQN51_008613 [Onygenales sp. PD_10]